MAQLEDSLGSRLRPEFDIFQNRSGLVYLDTAATALKPNKVLQVSCKP
jgi:selenocysteine lyase/cysteine desulfurase